MIDDATLARLVRNGLPDADVRIQDRTGTMDHFNLTVRSRAFKGKTPLEQHRLVYAALKPALADGRVHAVELTTVVPTEN